MRRGKQPTITLSLTSLICSESNGVIFYRDGAKCHQHCARAFTSCHLLSLSRFPLRFSDSLHQLRLLSRLSSAISLQSISLERDSVRQRRAFQAANNVCGRLCIPNSDSGRRLAKLLSDWLRAFTALKTNNVSRVLCGDQ